jgi:hypothetical protein
MSTCWGSGLWRGRPADPVRRRVDSQIGQGDVPGLIQQDYILRLIEQLGVFLRRLLRSQKDLGAALEEENIAPEEIAYSIDETCRRGARSTLRHNRQA